jgi:tetratricopeptide (TPR) repeat protein
MEGCQRAYEDDRLARYVSGEAPEPERDAFEIHVLECDACRAALEAHLDLAEVLRANRPRDDPRRASAFRAPGWLPLAAGLAVAVLAGTVLLRRVSTPTTAPGGSPPSNAPTPSTATKAPPPPIAPALEKPAVALPADLVVRLRGGGKGSFLADFGRAIEPYRNDDYAQAAERLADLARRHPKSPEARFYQGVSLLFLGRAAEAVEVLEQAAALAEGPQRDDVEWYLSLALMRADRSAAAVTHLEAVCGRAGPRQEAACATLRGPARSP